MDSILCCFIFLAILFQRHSPRSALSLALIYPKILWEMLGHVVKEKKEHFLMYCHVHSISSGFFGVGFYGDVFLMEHLRLLFAFNMKFFSFFSFFLFPTFPSWQLFSCIYITQFYSVINILCVPQIAENEFLCFCFLQGKAQWEAISDIPWSELSSPDRWRWPRHVPVCKMLLLFVLKLCFPWVLYIPVKLLFPAVWVMIPV